MSKVLVTVVVFLASVLAVGCTFRTPGGLVGSGKLITEERDVSGFTRVEASSAFEISITKSESYSVKITSDDNIIEHIRTDKSGDTLEIDLDRPLSINVHTLRAEIAMPEIAGLILSGASKCYITGFESAMDLDMDLSGASRVTGNIAAGDVEMVISGASRLEVTGTADVLRLDVSGASRAELERFEVGTLFVQLSGASNATVSASDIDRVEASGASKLSYVGDPVIGTVRVSGASSVNRQ
jgi:hypothetical protein